MSVIKDIYDFELQRKDEITGRHPIALSIITVLGGVLVFHVGNYRVGQAFSSVLKGCGLAVYFVLLCLSVYNFFMGLLCRTYKAIATASELLTWQKSVIAHFGSGQQAAAQQAISAGIEDRMAMAADHNACVNEIRDGYLERTYLLLGWGAVICLVYSICAATTF